MRGEGQQWESWHWHHYFSRATSLVLHTAILVVKPPSTSKGGGWKTLVDKPPSSSKMGCSIPYINALWNWSHHQCLVLWNCSPRHWGHHWPGKRVSTDHMLSLYTQYLLHNQQHCSYLQHDWSTAAAAASGVPPSGLNFTNRSTNIKQHILNWQSKQSNKLKQTPEMDYSSKTTSNTHKNDDNPCIINKYRTYKHSHVVLTMPSTE